MRRLLEQEQIGERKPSSFLRHLRSLAGPTFPDDLLKTIWMGRLPKFIQTVLATQRFESLVELSELGDKLIEINSQSTSQVCSTQAFKNMPQPDVHELTKKVDELTRMVAALTTAQSGSGNTNSRNSRSRRRSRSRSRNVDLCFYHDRFAAKAHRCVSPCKWSGPLPSKQGEERSNR